MTAVQSRTVESVEVLSRKAPKKSKIILNKSIRVRNVKFANPPCLPTSPLVKKDKIKIKYESKKREDMRNDYEQFYNVAKTTFLVKLGVLLPNKTKQNQIK